MTDDNRGPGDVSTRHRANGQLQGPDPLPGSHSLARNVLSNWVAMALSVAATFVTTPIVVGALQKERYGVWSFLNGLLVYSDLLYLGLGAAVIKGVAAFRARSDQQGLNRVSSVVVSIYTVLGLLCLGTLIGVSVVLPRLFATPLSADTQASARYACVLLGGQLLFSFVGSGFSGILYGLDRFDLVNAIRLFSITGRTVAIVTLVGNGNPLVMLACIASATAAFEMAGAMVLAFRTDRALVIRPVVPQRNELAALYSFGLQSFALIFATTLSGYTDTTVIGVMLGAASVAVYALPMQLVEYVRVAASGASGVLLPRLTVAAERGDIDRLRNAYVRTVRSVAFLSVFLATHVIALGPAFLTLWVGADFGNNAYWVIACLSLAVIFHIVAVIIPSGFYQAMGLLRVPALVLLAEAVANLVLSVLFARQFGIVGVALGTLVPALVVSCFVLPPHLWRHLRLPVTTAMRALLPAAVLLFVLLGTQALLRLGVGESSYVLLAVRVALAVPSSVVVFALLFPADDRRWMYGFARSLRV